jgi:hypothetical protein
MVTERYDPILRRQVESNPHRLLRLWEIIFSFVRNVVTCKPTSLFRVSSQVIEKTVHIVPMTRDGFDWIGSTCALV